MRMFDKATVTARNAIAVALGAALLAGCAQSNRPSPQQLQRIDRALRIAPGAAQPSDIVATEIAFARTAQAQGQWTAFAQFGTPSAQLHGPQGPVSAQGWLASQSNPEVANSWASRSVVMSCDGALAASQGRYATPQGLVGTYVTIWQRQQNGDYRYVHDVAGLDDPQPERRNQETLPEGSIVVTAIDSISGLVADCPRDRNNLTAPPAISLVRDGAHGAKLSRDGTLRWRWEHRVDGAKYIAVEFFSGGQWQTALEETFVSPNGL
jgi:hypothetical protein